MGSKRKRKPLDAKSKKQNVSARANPENTVSGSLSLDNTRAAGNGIQYSWWDLPEEIQRVVLANLPMGQISSWVQVCKGWRNQTKSNSFWKLVKEHQSAENAISTIPDRIFAHKKAAQLLRSIFIKNLLSKNYAAYASPRGRLYWDMDNGATYIAQTSPTKHLFVLPPASRITQTIDFSQVGINKTFLKHIGPIQFVVKARFRFPSNVEGATAIAYIGLSQFGGGKMIRFDRMSNMSTDTDGWKNAKIVLETDGSSFYPVSNNKLNLHVSNVITTQPTDSDLEVADIELFLQIISHATATPVPDCAYGLEDT